MIWWPTMEMARSPPDLYRNLFNRFGMFVRKELNKFAKIAAGEGHAPLSEVELDVAGAPPHVINGNKGILAARHGDFCRIVLRQPLYQAHRSARHGRLSR
jgi:hypothetical protein